MILIFTRNCLVEMAYQGIHEARFESLLVGTPHGGWGTQNQSARFLKRLSGQREGDDTYPRVLWFHEIGNLEYRYHIGRMRGTVLPEAP